MMRLKQLWLFRFFIVSSVKNELSNRLSRSKLGILWLGIAPMLQVAIFAFILSSIMSSKLPGVNNTHAYALYLVTGITAWSLFSDIVMRLLTLYVDNAPLIKKMSIPIVAFPLISIGSAWLNHLFLLFSVMIVFFFLDHNIGWMILWIPFLTLMTTLLAVGIGLTLGVLNVFIRDVGQMMPIMLQFGYWFTPIVYTISIIPERYHPYFLVNPLYHLFSMYHNVFLYKLPPAFSSVLIVALVASALLFIAFGLLAKAKNEMMEVL
ncbi:ABC transporter permease [Sulfuricurvum sp.]|uniref:ABC transporter permease n=1 Tax=Sulfuricurvum sp. TaxID=2025608 RepID=UPI0035690B1B